MAMAKIGYDCSIEGWMLSLAETVEKFFFSAF